MEMIFAMRRFQRRPRLAVRWPETAGRRNTYAARVRAKGENGEEEKLGLLMAALELL